jgi:hypothetical protein
LVSVWGGQWSLFFRKFKSFFSQGSIAMMHRALKLAGNFGDTADIHAIKSNIIER